MDRIARPHIVLTNEQECFLGPRGQLTVEFSRSARGAVGWNDGLDGVLLALPPHWSHLAYFGLFNPVTEPQQRSKGYATQLVAGMLQWARQQGAQHAYLQVVQSNLAARRLYAKLGFQETYQYWYRVAGTSTWLS